MQPVELDSPNFKGFGLNKLLEESAENVVKKTSTANSFSNNSFFFSFFGLINNIVSLHLWHASYYYLQCFLPMFQFIAAHYWCAFILDEFGSDKIPYIRYLNSLVSFSTEPENGVVRSYVFIILASLVVISLITIFATVEVIKNKLNVSRFLFYASSFILQIVLYGISLPIGYLIGVSFNGIMSSATISVVSLIFTIILFTAIVYLNNISTQTINYMSSPSQAIFTSYDGSHTKLFFIIEPILIGAGQASVVFPSSYKIVVTILSAIIHCYLLYTIFGLPFATKLGNVLAGGFYGFAIIGDLLAAIFLMGVPFNGNIFLYIPIAVFICVSIVLNIIFKKKIAKISQMLTIIDGQDPLKIYGELDISTEEIGLYYLRAALIGNTISVLNGTYPLYIGEEFKTMKTWLAAAEVLAFVPGEHEAFLIAHDAVRSIFTKSTTEKIRLLRITRLEQIRYSNNDIQLSEAYATMKNKTMEGVSAVHQFWSDVSNGRQLSITNVSGIGQYIYEMNNHWKETLNTYPNDPKFAELYSIYNIECTGKFEKGVIWQVKSTHLGSGLHSGIDPLYRCFVISKPELVWKKIVDKYGNVATVMDGDNTISMTMTTRTANAEDKLAEDIEGGVIEKLCAENFLWPKLRIAITNITEKYVPPLFSLWKVARVFSLVIVFALLIVMIIMLSTSYNISEMNNQQIERLINIEESISFTFLSMLLKAANLTDQLYSISYYESYLPAGAARGEDYYSMRFDDIQTDFDTWTEYGISSYLGLFQAFAQAIINDVDMSILVKNLRDPSFNKTFCNGSYSMENASDGQNPIATKDAIVSVLWNHFIMTSDEYSNYISSSAVCESALIRRHLLPNLQDISSDLANVANAHYDSYSSQNRTILFVFVSIYILIIVPFSIASIVAIHFSQKRILGALLSVKPSGAIEGSNFICKRENTGKLHSNVQKQVQSSSYSLTLFSLLSIGFAAIVFIMPIIAYTDTNYYVNVVFSVLKYANYGSHRLAISQNILGLVTLQILGAKARQTIPNQYSYEGIEFTSHWNIEIIRDEFDKAVAALQSSHHYFLHGDNNDGLMTRFETIRDIHIKDNCGNIIAQTPYDSYSCLGIERLLSTFMLYATQIMDDIENGEAITLNHPNYIDLHHMTVSRVPMLLFESRKITNDYIASTVSSSTSRIYIYIMISLIACVFNQIFLFFVNGNYLRTLKALLILIRHLPPPIIAESKEIIESLSLSEQAKKVEDLDPLEVVFNGVSYPILCIGDNNIIEAANDQFLEIFGVGKLDIVGNSLNSILHLPSANENDATMEEQNAIRFLEKAEKLVNKIDENRFSYIVNLQCNEGVPIQVQMTAQPVEAANGKNNIIILVEDIRPLAAIRHELELLEKQVDVLANSLIPRTFALSIDGREKGFAFIAKSATVVAIRIPSAYDLVQQTFEPLDDLLSQLDLIVNRNPPFMQLRIIFDTIFYIGGIYATNDSSQTAVAGVKIALESKSMLENSLQKNENGVRYYISVITGGPLLCGLFGNDQLMFEITGQITDHAIMLLESAPADMVVVSEDTKKGAMECESNDIKFDHQGTLVLGKMTYLF